MNAAVLSVAEFMLQEDVLLVAKIDYKQNYKSLKNKEISEMKDSSHR